MRTLAEVFPGNVRSLMYGERVILSVNLCWYVMCKSERGTRDGVCVCCVPLIPEDVVAVDATSVVWKARVYRLETLDRARRVFLALREIRDGESDWPTCGSAAEKGYIRGINLEL